MIVSKPLNLKEYKPTQAPVADWFTVEHGWTNCFITLTFTVPNIKSKKLKKKLKKASEK